MSDSLDQFRSRFKFSFKILDCFEQTDYISIQVTFSQIFRTCGVVKIKENNNKNQNLLLR